MATSDKLKYGKNLFLSETKTSHEKRVKLFIYHTARLKAYTLAYPADADYTELYLRSSPIADELQARYTAYYSVKGAQTEQTKNVDLELASIKGAKGKARDWFNRTSAVYAIANSARMQAIFPNGLKSFREKKDNIISAISTLSQNIGPDPNPMMMAIRGEVEASFGILNPDRTSQKTAITSTGIKSSELDAICETAMIMEYRNTGRIMDKHYDNIDNIQESFHDMELLLSKQQSTWNIHLDANENKNIATRTQVFNSKFKAKTEGGNANMYLSSTPNGIDSTAVNLIDGLEKKFTAEDFHINDYATHRYITIVNQSGVVISFSLKLG